MDGSIEPYQNTTEGAEIFFRCNPGFVPAGRMRAVCRADGKWSPDPATLVCTCEYHINLHHIQSVAVCGTLFCHQVTVSLSVTVKYLMYLVHKLMTGTSIYSTYRLSGGD